MTRSLHTSSRLRHTLLVALLVAVALPGTALASSHVAHRTALSAVDQLVVKGRGPMTGYDRSRFGDAWVDVNRNGCDTRDDILRRDLRHRTVRAGTHGCVITSGTLADPYTATSLRYVRGHSRIDIDHVVALGDAWQMGAARWAPAVRISFANDPLNLLAVSASANRQKGDSDTASWLPKARRFRCAYVARQAALPAWGDPCRANGHAPRARRVPDVAAAGRHDVARVVHPSGGARIREEAGHAEAISRAGVRELLGRTGGRRDADPARDEALRAEPAARRRRRRHRLRVRQGRVRPTRPASSRAPGGPRPACARRSGRS